MASVLIYGGVMLLFRSGGPKLEDESTLRMLEYALLAAYLGGAGFFLNILRPKMVAAARGLPEAALFAKYQQMVIVGNAFFEAGAIYGIVLVFLGAPVTWFVALGATALGLMLTQFPSAQKYQDFVRASRGHAGG